MSEHRIAILGDSRVFDTYYATAIYGQTAYGYHRTFPHLLQRMLARQDGTDIDVIHIPDHFRGRTVQNNILRLALIDPSVVVLCDGIWESLISKKHFLAYVEQAISAADAHKSLETITYSADSIVELFAANRLGLSPKAYAERVATITSWFTRRRRNVVWLTTPIPPQDHLGGLHYAGDYRPFPGWHRCLEILNRETATAAKEAGAAVIDLHELMGRNGGAAACLIDQWHFSTHFHRVIAEHLADWARKHACHAPPASSSRAMVQASDAGLAVHVIASEPDAAHFTRAHPDLRITGATAEPPVHGPARGTEAYVIIAPPCAQRIASANALLECSDRELIILFPEDFAPLDNPAGSDRSTFGSFK